jgi:hypothetical protein
MVNFHHQFIAHAAHTKKDLQNILKVFLRTWQQEKSSIYHWFLQSSQIHQIPDTILRPLPPGQAVTLGLPHLGHFSGFTGFVLSLIYLRSEP